MSELYEYNPSEGWGDRSGHITVLSVDGAIARATDDLERLRLKLYGLGVKRFQDETELRKLYHDIFNAVLSPDPDYPIPQTHSQSHSQSRSQPRLLIKPVMDQEVNLRQEVGPNRWDRLAEVGYLRAIFDREAEAEAGAARRTTSSTTTSASATSATSRASRKYGPFKPDFAAYLRVDMQTMGQNQYTSVGELKLEPNDEDSLSSSPALSPSLAVAARREAQLIEAVCQTLWYLAVGGRLFGYRHAILFISDRFKRFVLLDRCTVAVEVEPTSEPEPQAERGARGTGRRSHRQRKRRRPRRSDDTDVTISSLPPEPVLAHPHPHFHNNADPSPSSSSTAPYTTELLDVNTLGQAMSTDPSCSRLCQMPNRLFHHDPSPPAGPSAAAMMTPMRLDRRAANRMFTFWASALVQAAQMPPDRPADGTQPLQSLGPTAIWGIDSVHLSMDAHESALVARFKHQWSAAQKNHKARGSVGAESGRGRRGGPGPGPGRGRGMREQLEARRIDGHVRGTEATAESRTGATDEQAPIIGDIRQGGAADNVGLPSNQLHTPSRINTATLTRSVDALDKLARVDQWRQDAICAGGAAAESHLGARDSNEDTAVCDGPGSDPKSDWDWGDDEHKGQEQQDNNRRTWTKARHLVDAMAREGVRLWPVNSEQMDRLILHAHAQTQTQTPTAAAPTAHACKGNSALYGDNAKTALKTESLHEENDGSGLGWASVGPSHTESFWQLAMGTDDDDDNDDDDDEEAPEENPHTTFPYRSQLVV